MRETAKHIQAFEKYYGMGNTRTLASLADHFGITERTAKQWSREFHWQDRIAQRDQGSISHTEANPQAVDELQRRLTALEKRISALERGLHEHRISSAHRRF